MIDQNHVILYRNDMGVHYKTMTLPTQFYPFDNVINVYHNSKGEPIKLEDDQGNRYTIISRNELETYTWESIPVELHPVRATLAHFYEPST